MPAPSQGTIDGVADVRALRRALERGAGGGRDAAAVLAGVSRARRALADPLGADARASVPDPALRATLVARPEAALPAPPGARPIRLAADAVSVAVALADDLYINEADAAMLLADARPAVLRRHDRDVVAAAKELFYARRREQVLFLQEMLRVHLLSDADRATQDDAAFHEALIRERDALVVEHALLENIVVRIDAGLPSLAAPSPASPRPSPANRSDVLVNDEAVLLAECVFLLTYSVQTSAKEALAVRDLLSKLVDLVASIRSEEESASQRHAYSAGQQQQQQYQQHRHQGVDAAQARGSQTESSSTRSYVLTRAESVRNIVFLAWICCIDRSRYSDMYDPRTGVSGVNALLRDPVFIKRSCGLPSLTPDSFPEDPAELPELDAVVAAAELAGALFRLATAEPDKEEAVFTALRTCAYGEALEYLSGDLATWIEKGAGMLLPDAHLYADVFEDLAFDLSEAPDIAYQLFRYTQDEVQSSAAAEVTYGSNSSEMFPYMAPLSTPSSLPGTPGHRRAGSQPTPGKPPKPPIPGRSSFGAPSPGGMLGASFAGPPGSRHARAGSGIGDGDSRQGAPVASAKKPKNLVALLGYLVARAVQLAPGKLMCDSVGGGSRYWVGVGPDAVGIVSRLAECVLDLFDAAFRSSDALTVYGEACAGALESFLKVLAVTALPAGNVVHAAASLRFLCHAGHSVVSIDRTLQSLNQYNETVSSHPSSGVPPLSPLELSSLIGVLEIISNCAVSLSSQGGLGPIMGRSSPDLASRIAALAVQDVSSNLRAALVRCLIALEDHRASVMFLEDVTKNKSAKLRQMIRGHEAELGCYDATVAVLELASQSCLWPHDEFSSYAVDGVAVFALEEVIAHWSQRKYFKDCDRWRLMRVAAELLTSIVSKERVDGDGVLADSVLSRLLCPAPGTGAASPALRALVSCAGLRRTADDSRGVGGALKMGLSFGTSHGQEGRGYLYVVSGRDSLAHAASCGDGEAFREMELSAAACARTLTFTLSLLPSQFSSHAMVTARASDLLLSEPKALVASASLVFAVDECTAKPSPFRLGYSPTTCAAILEMLAAAASQSTLICKLLTRSDEPAASALFRCSLADVVASYNFANAIGRCEEDWITGQGDGDHDDRDTLLGLSATRVMAKDRPRMHSALRLVEACLGMDGGGKPGLYLLGLVMDIGDHLQDGEYGVLSALMELVSGIGNASSDRIDERSRSTAAVFLERLAGNTTAKTSCAVLEFIRNVGATDVHGGPREGPCGGFGDVMLSRILGFCAAFSTPPDAVDWCCLGELGGACMKLSALLVRQFPRDEEEHFSSSDSMTVAPPLLPLGARDSEASQGVDAGYALPSPDALLRFVASVAGHGKADVAVDAFRSWHQLLGSRLSVHPVGRGYGAVPLLLDICTTLLDALESSDGSGSNFTKLVAEDGGAEASAVILRCLGHIAVVATSHGESPDEFLGDSQAGVLLSKVVHALASRSEGRADASQTRTSLYASFLVCGQLCEAKASDESIAQAFAGRMGPRHTGGAEALVSVACEDGISGPSAASRAASLVCMSVACRLDAVRVVPALSSQNRLRRLVSAAIGDPVAQTRIVRSCARVTSEEDYAAVENGALIVAESALGLIHAVAGALDGVRALADAACLDSIASLLDALSSPRRSVCGNGDFGDGEEDTPVTRFRGGSQTRLRNDSADANGEDPYETDTADWQGDVDASETPSERFAAVAGMLTAAVAASVVSSDSVLVDGALSVLQAGERTYSRIIRSLGRTRKVYMMAVGHVAIVLSRIPPRILTDSAVPSLLRSLLGCHIGFLVPSSVSGGNLGGSGSPLSIGLGRVMPRSARDARRYQIQHPAGGSLFERDLISMRLDCLKCVFAALRPPSGILTFFSPQIEEDPARGVEFAAEGPSHFVDDVTGRQGSLGDILRISRAALLAMQHSAEESMRLSSSVADETPASLSSRRVTELADFCMEEMDLENVELVTSQLALDCLLEAAKAARREADSCVNVLESGLFILREYTTAACEALRGISYSMNTADESPLSVRDAETLVAEAQAWLLPLCTDIDALSATIWGSQDPSFCRQLSRQIRTSLTAERNG